MPAKRRELALKTTEPFRTRPLGHYIAGAPVSGDGEAFPIFDPSTGEELGQARDATVAELDSAVDAAVGAFHGWATTPGEKRKEILHRIADGIEARAEEIASIECLDAGQTWRFMSKAALRGAENFRFFADRAPGAAAPAALVSTATAPTMPATPGPAVSETMPRRISAEKTTKWRMGLSMSMTTVSPGRSPT